LAGAGYRSLRYNLARETNHTQLKDIPPWMSQISTLG
jgi:hypothetical protein